MPGLVRAFLIALAVSLGIPLLLLLLGFTPLFAMPFAYSIAPQLAFAFPAYLLLSPGHLVFAMWLSVLQMCLLSTAFAFATRPRTVERQIIWAVIAFLGWWLLCRAVLGHFGVTANFGTRM
jgi:hypothetical protein